MLKFVDLILICFIHKLHDSNIGVPLVSSSQVHSFILRERFQNHNQGNISPKGSSLVRIYVLCRVFNQHWKQFEKSNRVKHHRKKGKPNQNNEKLSEFRWLNIGAKRMKLRANWTHHALSSDLKTIDEATSLHSQRFTHTTPHTHASDST